MKLTRLQEIKLEALNEYLDTDGQGCFVDVNTIEHEDSEYLVLTEDERDEYVRSYIEDSVSYFNASFLSNMTGLPERVFKVLTDENETVLALIEATCGIDEFVEEAVDTDGYGHFLSLYDGNELELESDLYAYII